MAYETGTVVTQDEMINKIKVFLEANGMVTDTFIAQTNSNYWLHMHHSTADIHVDFRTEKTVNAQVFPATGMSYSILGPVLAMRISGGYDSAKLWHSQPDGPMGVSGAGIPLGYVLGSWNTNITKKYHMFFHESPTVDFYCIVEMVPGIFGMFGFGNLVKAGTWEGGRYACGNFGANYGQIKLDAATIVGPMYARMDGPLIPFANSGSSGSSVMLKATIDSYTGYFGTQLSATNNGQFSIGLGGYISGSMCLEARAPGDSYYNLAPCGDPQVPYFNTFMTSNQCGGNFGQSMRPGAGLSSFGGPTPMFPAYIYGAREPFSAGMWSLLGTAPNFMYLNIANLTDGQTYTLGSDSYKIFPHTGRDTMAQATISNGVSASYTSWSNGYAIKI